MLATLTVMLVTSCIPRLPTAAQMENLARDVAAKDVADRECARLESTCAGYVACRRRVAAEHKAPFVGRCEP